jgi:hypothetical protein
MVILASVEASAHTEAARLFDDALTWFHDTYASHRFYTERDVVWTLQKWLALESATRGLPYQTYNDFGVEPGLRRALSADIALVVPGESPDLAVEFKYEPSHLRDDIPRSKIPVVGWTAVLQDVERIHRWVAEARIKAGAAVLIDEGRFFRAKVPAPGSMWMDWGSRGAPELDVSIHLSYAIGAD